MVLDDGPSISLSLFSIRSLMGGILDQFSGSGRENLLAKMSGTSEQRVTRQQEKGGKEVDDVQDRSSNVGHVVMTPLHVAELICSIKLV